MSARPALARSRPFTTYYSTLLLPGIA